MTAELVRQEIQKVSSMVTTARRLLNTGTMVDLSALEGRVRTICESLAAMERDEGRGLLPDMETLIADLDRLSAAIHDRCDPVPDAAGEPGPGDPAPAL